MSWEWEHEVEEAVHSRQQGRRKMLGVGGNKRIGVVRRCQKRKGAEMEKGIGNIFKDTPLSKMHLSQWTPSPNNLSKFQLNQWIKPLIRSELL